jgi:hypothetical protein
MLKQELQTKVQEQERLFTEETRLCRMSLPAALFLLACKFIAIPNDAYCLQLFRGKQAERRRLNGL